MSNIIPFCQRKAPSEDVRQQSCAWLARLDAGMSDDDMEALKQWLREDQEHVRVFFAAAALWDQISVLSELSDMFPLGQYSKPQTAGNGRRVKAAIAAMILVAVCTLLWQQSWLPGSEAGNEVANVIAEIHETQVGQQANIRLEDGSEVILNTNTRIRVVYSEQARNIFLGRGEAYFTVAHDPAKPFRVYAGNRMVEATGTAFTVQRRDGDGLEVLVTEGSVSLSRVEIDAVAVTSDEFEVMPAQELPVIPLLSLAAGEGVASVPEALDELERKRIQLDELEVRLSWRHGMLLFKGESLEEVLREVSRYTTIRLEADDAIKEVKVEGYFRAGDINGLLFAMRENFQIQAVEIGQDHIFLNQL